MHRYKYLIPVTSAMKGCGLLNVKSLNAPYTFVRTLRNAPHNNFVVTLRGKYVIAVNVTGGNP